MGRGFCWVLAVSAQPWVRVGLVPSRVAGSRGDSTLLGGSICIAALGRCRGALRFTVVAKNNLFLTASVTILTD